MVKYFTLSALLLLFNTTCQNAAFSEKFRAKVKASQPNDQGIPSPESLWDSSKQGTPNHFDIPGAISLTSPTSASIINWTSIERRQAATQKSLEKLIPITQGQPSQENFPRLSQIIDSDSSKLKDKFDSIRGARSTRFTTHDAHYRDTISSTEQAIKAKTDEAIFQARIFASRAIEFIKQNGKSAEQSSRSILTTYTRLRTSNP